MSSSLPSMWWAMPIMSMARAISIAFSRGYGSPFASRNLDSFSMNRPYISRKRWASSSSEWASMSMTSMKLTKRYMLSYVNRNSIGRMALTISSSSSSSKLNSAIVRMKPRWRAFRVSSRLFPKWYRTSALETPASPATISRDIFW